MLGSLILYLKAMRKVMFQLSGFYCRAYGRRALGLAICMQNVAGSAVELWGFGCPEELRLVGLGDPKSDLGILV